MKRILLPIAIILFSTNIFAQSNPYPMDSRFKIDMGFSGVGIAIETPLSAKFLLGFDAGLGGGYEIDDSFKYLWSSASPSIYASAKGEIIYNREKRVAKGKRIDNNSGNLVGFSLKYSSADIGGRGYNSNTVLFNAHWGIRRALGKSWIFSTYIGLGYAYDTDYSEGIIYPAFDLKFSYSIPLKKR